MSISIVNKHIFFNENKNASLFFKDYSFANTNVVKENDFIFILENKKVVGINIINYQNYFKLQEGFHSITEEVKDILIRKFPQYLSQEDFQPFYQIGQIIQIENHPSSDKLKVLKVLFKNNETKQIITNLQTLEQNKNYLFAQSGSFTYNGTRIIESKIANTLSQGMIMSYKSLGIDKEGIIDCSNLSINDEYVF